MHTPYGATEALPVASIASSAVLSETARQTDLGAGVCVGRSFPGIEWRVVEIHDGPLDSIRATNDLPQGKIGELIVRGPVVTTEYVTRTDANAIAKIRDDDGGFWHRMGDVGYLDEQHRFWFCGRMSQRVPLRQRKGASRKSVYNSVRGNLQHPSRRVPIRIGRRRTTCGTSARGDRRTAARKAAQEPRAAKSINR